MKLLRFLVLFVMMQCSLMSFSQNQSNEDVAGILRYVKTAMRFGQLRPQEKVYLHFDNTGYFKGETIWFKAYVVRTDDGAPTDLSKVLYVDLLNPSGDVVESRKLHIENGVAHGDIKVDSIMTTGFYEVRAYTRYMTNWGPNACFSRVFPIFKTPTIEGHYSSPEIDKISYRKRLNNEREESIDSPNENVVSMDESSSASSSAAGVSNRVHFYPEGGDIVQGLPCRVAFSLVDKEGMPMRATCSLLGKDGSVLSTTTTDSHGYGVVSLTGSSEKMYLQADGKKYQLPSAKPQGCTMHIDMLHPSVVTVDLYTSAEMQQGGMLGYAMVHNGKVVRCDTLTADAHVIRTFDRDNLPEGVSQITFFNKEGRILSERMFFICPKLDGSERVNVVSDVDNLRPCGKVKFTLTSKPNADLSFSAVDASGLVNGSNGNMLSWMLLSSELRGYIAHPEYYFESDDEAHRRAADLLMMVQGWRRYDWSLMSGQSTMLKFEPIEDKQYLFGRLREKSKKNSVAGVWLDTKMYNFSGQVVEGTTKTDSLGNYVFILPEIEGEWNLSINTGVEGKNGYWKDVNYYVAIDRNFAPAGRYVSPLEASAIPVDTTKLFKWNFSDKDEQWVSMTHKDHVLQQVTVKARGHNRDYLWKADEKNARRNSLIYYNCDDASDRIADEGEPSPLFVDWIKSKNSFFGGEAEPTDIYIASPADEMSEHSPTGNKIVEEIIGEPPFEIPIGYIRFYADGLSYKNRQIIWIVDNQFCTITNYNRRQGINVQVNDNLSNSAIELPVFLDEVKSVYISEELEPLHRHFMCSDIESANPVVMYVFTHNTFAYKQKGMRNTRYQGYNIPSTFEMEDYSVIPPVEDYRRTIYWQPDIKTDDKGKATIEFWNNSSCKEMHISCEGMTPQGNILTF